MCITRLQQKGHLSRVDYRTGTPGITSLYDRPSKMQRDSIHQQNRLELAQKRPEGETQLPHNASLQPRIIPSTLLSDQFYISRARRLQAREITSKDSTKVSYDHLGEKRLQFWPVANKCHISHTSSPFAPVCSLDRLSTRWIPSLPKQHRTLALPLPQANRCFVHVNPQHRLACRKFIRHAIEPLPSREGLCTRKTRPEKKREHEAPVLGPAAGPKRTPPADTITHTQLLPLHDPQPKGSPKTTKKGCQKTGPKETPKLHYIIAKNTPSLSSLQPICLLALGLCHGELPTSFATAMPKLPPCFLKTPLAKENGQFLATASSTIPILEARLLWKGLHLSSGLHHPPI